MVFRCSSIEAHCGTSIASNCTIMHQSLQTNFFCVFFFFSSFFYTFRYVRGRGKLNLGDKNLVITGSFNNIDQYLAVIQDFPISVIKSNSEVKVLKACGFY